MPPLILDVIWLNLMNLLNFLKENGEINLRGKFLSSRLVKDALGKKFNVRVVEEAPDYIKCRITRFVRHYGAPFIWPQASIEIWIDNKNDKLIYRFFWPEYLALVIPFFFFFIIEKSVQEVIVFFVFALIFFGFVLFLDTRWVSRKVRKAFESI